MSVSITGKIARIGYVLLGSGGIFSMFGIVGLIRFWFTHATAHQTKTADQLAKAAALPHILTVLGIGFVIFGAVLVTKARILKEERGL